MDGLPTTIRLLDPPLHEFLPDLTELSVKVALAEASGNVNEADVQLLAAVTRMHEANPMLGLRGVRLGLVVPGLFALQIRAICEAVAIRRVAGGDPHAEIMVPLVGSVQELRIIREEALGIMAEVGAEHGITLDLPVGVMIELPRAALTADRIAEEAQFFSFGTNDLTQTTWGFSRDDVEGAFFAQYTANGVLERLPVRDHRRRGCRASRADRRRGRPGRPPRPHDRRVRRARRGPGVHPVLRLRRAGLRVLLAVPGARRPARGRACVGRRTGHRRAVGDARPGRHP